MKLSEAFPSKYLNASDVSEPTRTKIKEAVEETVGREGKEQQKVVLYFPKKLKPLPLNKTNFMSVADICGSDDSDDFPGTEIELFSVKVQGPNGITDGVRIRAPGAVAAKSKRAAPKDSGEKPPFNDAVPY